MVRNEMANDFLDRVVRLSSPEEYEGFLLDLRSSFSDTEPVPAESGTDESDPEFRALELLRHAAWNLTPPVELLHSALASNHERLAAAAALCVSLIDAQDVELHRSLLVGSEPFKRKVSRFAATPTVKCLGFSGRRGFVEVLTEILDTRYHFYRPSTVAEALARLGEPVDREAKPYHRSITVIQGSSGLFISDDERFGGSSNCPNCRFFPCRINRYFEGPIEDCKLANRVDPAGAGEIFDQRDWGRHIEDSKVTIFEADIQMCKAGALLAEEHFLEAIPKLCSIIVGAIQKKVVAPAAWVRLARCFAGCGEDKLSFLAMREALGCGGTLPDSYVEEAAALASFSNDPIASFGPAFGARDARQLDDLAISYQGQDLWVASLDCYVDENILDRGSSPGNWFELGECHRELGELAIAGLFMDLAVMRAREITLREHFEAGAKQIHSWIAHRSDPGLNLERRARERALVHAAKSREAFLSTTPADDPDEERGYWAALLIEADADRLAPAVLDRLLPDSTGALLAIPSDVPKKIFGRLYRRTAETALDSIYGPNAQKRLGLGVEEVVERGLGFQGKRLIAAAIFAASHDRSFHRSVADDDPERGPILLASYRLRLLANLENDKANQLPPSDRLALVQSTLALLSGERTEDPLVRETVDALRRDLEARREHSVARGNETRT